MYILSSCILFIFGFSIFNIKDNYKSSFNYNIDLSRYSFYCFFIVLISYHIGYGFENIYYRQGYTISGDGVPIIRTIYTLLLPIVAILLAFDKKRIKRHFLLIILVIMVLGSSSRNVIMIPICYFIGTYLKNSKVSILQITFTILISVLLLGAVMECRNNPYQGVVPNLQYLIENGINIKKMFESINYLTSFSVFANMAVIQNFTLDLNSFFISINPLPSSFLNINNMVESQKINQYAPYPAFSTIVKSGPVFFSIYYISAGLLWGAIYKYISDKNSFIKLIILILFLVYVVMSTQYNLRGVNRLIYYSMIVIFLYKIKAILNFNLKKW
ncbi:hypothetical protein [Photobacterium angustum]|uniref:hypothetical protein n=1 Tax=Photobacterium angustum TaxID=661 RepID=UPI0011B0740F|nr:hypothetical protein [Photobacterium angustum]